jgi:hypothetical protein
VDTVDANPASRLPAHHVQAVPVEGAQAPLAQVGGEDVQLRLLGQLEQAGISVKKLFIVVFQQPGARQLPIRASQKAAQPAQRHGQGKPANDAVADIEPHEGKQLGRRRFEVAGRAVVTAPIQREVSGQNTAAGHRGNVRDLR